MSSRTPTTPSAPSASASSSMRVIASSRASHRLREHVHLDRLLPRGLLVADVVDRAADDEPERVEARLLDEEELVHRQVAREEPAAQLLDALAAMLGDPFHRARVVAAWRGLAAAGRHRGLGGGARHLRV